MFSGLVETTGLIQNVNSLNDCLKITVQPHISFGDLTVGDSVAVNGACLTVTACNDKTFQMVLVPETLRLMNAAALQTGNSVNLERALKANARLGGHYVQGHLDGMGQIVELSKDGKEALLVKIKIPEPLSKYLVRKGYVAIDGMSITTIDVAKDYFTVTFIPHTQEHTIVKNYHLGTFVNIEVDIFGKYIEKLLTRESS